MLWIVGWFRSNPLRYIKIPALDAAESQSAGSNGAKAGERV
jgi:hypothetical protein